MNFAAITPSAPPINVSTRREGIKPNDVIQNGIFVFEGHFEIPLAAAIGHRQKAKDLLAQAKPNEALIEAQRAVELAPSAVACKAVFGDVLASLNRSDEARLRTGA